MAKRKEKTLTNIEIQTNTFKQLKKYEGLNFFEQYAMYIGVAQLFELSLKKLLITNFGYEIDVLEKKTLGQTKNELSKCNIRPDFLLLLKNVVDCRNYIAHEILSNQFISQKLITGLTAKRGLTKEFRYLQKAIIELEQLVYLFNWTQKNGKWTE